MKLTILILTLAITPLNAQFHLGVKGGAPISDVTETISNGVSLKNLPSHWTLGPMVELDLPAGLGLEANILYRRVGYEYESASTGSSPLTGAKFTGALWDFPLLVKYRFPGIVARPYISGGFTYRRLNDLLRVNSNTNGFVLGAGVRIPALLISISPELRFTRWGSAPSRDVLGIQAKRNQAEILIGVTF